MTSALHGFDRPNSVIGRPVTRPDAERLVKGQGSYVDDIQLPRMLHAAFVRSPHAHARIINIALDDALEVPGVVAAYDGKSLMQHVTPYQGVLTHLTGLRSPDQWPLALDVARWQGEPVVMILANSRAIAEDAVEQVSIEYETLDMVCDAETALDPDTLSLIHI